MQNLEEKMDLPDINSEEFLKIAELKLKLMEEDYQRTLAAEKNDNFILKGKFEQENFNNVNFENPQPIGETSQNQIKNEEIENQANNDNEQVENIDNEPNENHENYQMISDEESENEKEEEEVEEWGEMQLAMKGEEIGKKEDDFKIDVEKIKNIMGKIQLKEPIWAASSDVWKMKLKEMCQDLTN